MPKVSNKINWETDSVSFYKFVCKDPQITFVYVGHTTNFASRKSTHKSICNNSKNTNHNQPLYQFIRANGGWENWTMIEIKSQICKSPRDAERVEQDLINQEHQVLNAQKAHSGVDLSSNHPNYHTQYRQQNRDAISIKLSQYYQQNKDTVKVKNAEYYHQNKASLIAKNVEYRYQNKDVINAKRRARYALIKSQMLCEILDKTNP
jgi:hypothetical protein